MFNLKSKISSLKEWTNWELAIEKTSVIHRHLQHSVIPDLPRRQAGSIRDPVGNDGKVKTQKLKVKSNSKWEIIRTDGIPYSEPGMTQLSQNDILKSKKSK